MIVSELNSVLQYKNDQLVDLYCRTKNISKDESEMLFIELKKLLWFLGQRDENASPFAILSTQSILDDYWHEFILYTKSYMEFCDLYFGRYIHHYPYDSHESIKNFVDKGYSSEHEISLLKKLEEQMKEVESRLGIETVRLWYVTIPQKYGRSKKHVMQS